MSDLLLMGGSSGLPRSGLVGLWDPYRDVYGRNCLDSSDVQTSNWPAAETSKVTTGLPSVPAGYDSHAVLLVESVNLQNHALACAHATGPAGTVNFSVLAKAKERTGISFYTGSPYTAECKFNLSDGTVISSTGWTAPKITALGDGWYRCSASLALNGTGVAWLAIRLLNGANTAWYTGDGSSGLYLSSPQATLSPDVMAFSIAAGAPSTLQTATDYSGRGNSLTLGATTGASTDDPAYTGVGLLFAVDFAKSGNLTGVTMAGDWSLPIVLKPSGTTGAIVSLADATAADQYQAIEFNGSTKVRIHTKNGATDTTSDDLTVSNSTVQMLSLVSSGNTITLKLMNTGASVSATNAAPTGTPRLVVGGLGTSTIGTLADGLNVNLLALYGRALSVSEETRIYRHVKSLFAGRGVAVA
jgi:hypothetical protein